MSLFKRPAWAKQQLSDDDNAGPDNIFSHSHAYQDIVAEQEKRKRDRAERRKAKAEPGAERRASAKREVKDEPGNDSTPKRRRITSEEKEKLLRSVGLPATLDVDNGDEPAIETTPVRRSSRKHHGSAGLEAARAPRMATVIDLGGSSSEDNHEDHQTTSGAPEAQPSAEVNNIAEDSDEEFAELARRAQTQRQPSHHRSSHTPHARGPGSPSPDLGVPHDPPPDPVVQLFITSPLPHTNPLIIQRKLSQPTGAVRQAWCQKQGFAKDVADRVFLTHRLRRVYDVTTCRSLGLDVDAWGNVVMKGAEGKAGVEKVHLEAVTEEVWAQMKEERVREGRVRSGEVVGEGAGKEGETEAEETGRREEEKSHIRIILKSKDFKPFNLKVKPTTTMSQIASAYAKKILNDPDKQVRLEFDGDELAPDDTVQATELEDMMTVDVHMV